MGGCPMQAIIAGVIVRGKSQICACKCLSKALILPLLGYSEDPVLLKSHSKQQAHHPASSTLLGECRARVAATQP